MSLNIIEGMGRSGLEKSIFHYRQSNHVIYCSNHNTSEESKGVLLITMPSQQAQTGTPSGKVGQ